MKKIVVVGGGNAGCFTALYCGWYGRQSEYEVELIYNPEIPPEKVGQATILEPPALLWASTGFNWYHNKINATFKSGILYEGWGKVNKKHFHPFPANAMAMHYCPWEMQESVLSSGHFKVVEDDVDPKDVDSDYVFDCRGKPDNYDGYEELINPTNACILGKPKWNTAKNPWSRHVATPDGWTFVIPTNKKSPSHDYCVGYCYNSDITPPDEAAENFTKQFDVEITKYIKYKNYVIKEPIINDRIVVNGNRLFFLEPLESSSMQVYIEMVRSVFEYLLPGRCDRNYVVTDIKKYIKQLQNFVLWHYQFGSKYDTAFWEYAKTLKFEDEQFDMFLNHAKTKNWYDVLPNTFGGCTKPDLYGQWPAYSFKNWYDGMNTKLNT
jgi:tryptophan halogenase|tara:strand:- start:22 stop:1161 length:1140 start_codon:yes stop_codon:yes gene_type:complete